MSGDAYAGVRRRKQTPWRVKFGDAVASRLITVGGMGTIIAVMLVVLVLFAGASPLFRSPTFSDWQTHPIQSSDWLHGGVDEHGLVFWLCDQNGQLVFFSAHDGKELASFALVTDSERKVTASSVTTDRTHLVLGFSDGTYQMTSIGFQSSLLQRADLPESVRLSADNRIAVSEGSLYELFDADDVRKVDIVPPQWTEAAKLADKPIRRLDYIPPSTSNQFSSQSSSLLGAVSDDELILADIQNKENMLTGEIKQEVSLRRTALQSRSKAPPLHLMIANRATQALLVWDIGTIDRFALEGTAPQAVESTSGLPAGGRITCAETLLGRQTLLIGDDHGVLHGWMIVQSSADAESDVAATAAKDSSDDYRLAEAHEIPVSDKPIRNIASSAANHLALVTCEDDRLGLVMVTTDSLLKTVSSPKQKQPTHQSWLSIKNNLAVSLTKDTASIAALDTAYPEATWRGLFGYVWYEGHAEPKAIWQSSAGTETAEPKLSLIPLVFGTLKATVYAMLFSVPLAILAAIYTSEFLSPGVRARVKPFIEMMASLPSVVLGFIAALVLAPLLQQVLCTVLIALLTVPMSFVFGAHLWNLLPMDRSVRLQRWRLGFIALCLPAGIGAAILLSSVTEQLFFAGNIVQWLGGRTGSGVGAWMLLLIPLLTVLCAVILIGPMAESDRRRAVSMSHFSFAVFSLVRLIALTAAVVFAAWLVGRGLDTVGLDLRQSLFKGYSERNSLLVGAVLGFCVIPLIYTLADDALQSVPQQLRSASLGCGATPWQTTLRVVVPSAISGIFSAVMIGLGRAVGETMVVLMAAGNTPILEWNPFNGFRTLSATLATELPEAAKGSTHYRTLFLAALLLFMLTLVANTLAEFVRIRFRKRTGRL
ncbi:MAG: ABC transporter permease subunit [Pirellulales bacterium]